MDGHTDGQINRWQAHRYIPQTFWSGDKNIKTSLRALYKREYLMIIRDNFC